MRNQGQEIYDRLVNVGPLWLLVAVGGALNYSCVSVV
jgi:hypothetical protein